MERVDYDETSGIPREAGAAALRWGQNSDTILGNSQRGLAGVANFPRRGWRS